MKISDLNTKVTLQQCTMVPDGFGGFLSLWEFIEEIWAKIEPIKFKDIQKSKASSFNKYKVIIRKRNDLSNKMRIKSEDLFLEFENIKSVDNYYEIITIRR